MTHQKPNLETLDYKATAALFLSDENATRKALETWLASRTNGKPNEESRRLLRLVPGWEIIWAGIGGHALTSPMGIKTDSNSTAAQVIRDVKRFHASLVRGWIDPFNPNH